MIPLWVIGVIIALVFHAMGVKLARDGDIAGVCTGVARRFDLSVGGVQLLWFLWLLCGGGGFITYIACWCLLNEEDEDEEKPRKRKRK